MLPPSRSPHDFSSDTGSVSAEMAIGMGALVTIVLVCALLASGFLAQAKLTATTRNVARELSRAETALGSDSHLSDGFGSSLGGNSGVSQSTDIAFNITRESGFVRVEATQLFKPLPHGPAFPLHAKVSMPLEQNDGFTTSQTAVSNMSWNETSP